MKLNTNNNNSHHTASTHHTASRQRKLVTKWHPLHKMTQIVKSLHSVSNCVSSCEQFLNNTST